MKNTFLIAGLILAPTTSIAAVTAYIADLCDSNLTNNDNVELFCSGEISPCEGSANRLEHIISNSTYKDYTRCIPLKTDPDYADITYLVCFTSLETCQKFKSCHEEYAATPPQYIYLSNYLTQPGLTTITNEQVFTCCNSGNCIGVGSSITNYLNYNANLATAMPYKCVQTNTSGSAMCSLSTTAADKVAFCTDGAYSSKGVKYKTIGSFNPYNYSSSLSCTACPTPTDMYTDSTRTTAATPSTAPGANEQSDCYIKAGMYYDTSGEFTFSEDCGY